MVTHESELLGVSEIGSDMRDLLEQEASDIRAAEAVELFCYQAKKWIGSFAAVLGGVDTLVFAGGIGENSPKVSEAYLEDLGFLGISFSPKLNESGDSVISTGASRTKVRLIQPDEEQMIAPHHANPFNPVEARPVSSVPSSRLPWRNREGQTYPEPVAQDRITRPRSVGACQVRTFPALCGCEDASA